MLQAKNREINIFNLSMMDVISGAMGAFLIIMIILSRYYDSDPANKQTVVKIEEELKKALDRMDETQRLAELRQGDVDRMIQEIRAAKYNIDSAQDQLKDVQEQLDQAKSNLDRLEEEKEELEKVNKGLDARRPFLLNAWWACPNGNIDMYIFDSAQGSDGHGMPPFNPDEQQWSYWTGDNYIDGGGLGNGTETWMTLAVYPDVVYKLYFKIDQGKEAAEGCSVSSKIFSRYFKTVDIPDTKLDKNNPWVLVGSFQVNEDREIGEFKEASAAEREKEKELVPVRLEEFKAVQEKRDQYRKEKNLKDPNEGLTEETQLPGSQLKKTQKPFWQWWK